MSRIVDRTKSGAICRKSIPSRSVGGAGADAFGVAGEVFGVGEGDDGGGVVGEAFGGVADDGGAFEEFVDADAAREACGGIGGEAVAWAGDVIAGGDGGVWAEEDGAGVSELGEDDVVVGGLEVDVFGGEAVGEGDSLVHRTRDDDGASVVEGFGDGGFAV